MAEGFVIVLGVVRVVVRLTIVGPAGVGIVEAEVIRMSLYKDSVAGRSKIDAFYYVRSSATTVTVGFTFAIEEQLRSKSCAGGIPIAEFQIETLIPLMFIASLPAFEATPVKRALACAICS